MNKKFLIFAIIFLMLPLCGCGQMIADAMFSNQYLQPISKSYPINASSKKKVVNAAIAAATKTNWITKTISVETGYILAENVADPKFTRGKRDYTFRLEVHIPEDGKGDVNISITPPSGLLSSKSMDELADEYFEALAKELKQKTNQSLKGH